ncbi:MAG: hypothetical protein CMJ78_25735 [Planctomycetaceae bacterium]|nr:hypothetical protein [Planctomycetaceae bacterium]
MTRHRRVAADAAQETVAHGAVDGVRTMALRSRRGIHPPIRRLRRAVVLFHNPHAHEPVELALQFLDAEGGEGLAGDFDRLLARKIAASVSLSTPRRNRQMRSSTAIAASSFCSIASR